MEAQFGQDDGYYRRCTNHLVQTGEHDLTVHRDVREQPLTMAGPSRGLVVL